VDSLDPILVGKQRYMNFTVNVTNNDFPGCAATSFNLGAGTPYPRPGWSLVLSQNSLVLEPNSTGQFVVTATSRENLQPGNYSLSVFVSDSKIFSGYALLIILLGGIVNHSGGNHTTLEVTCPNPRAVTKITAKAIVPYFSFGLQEGPVYLSWDGCVTPLWCCCPCT
jgi:hypothetical protein